MASLNSTGLPSGAGIPYLELVTCLSSFRKRRGFEFDFLQLEVEEENIHKTAFRARCGHCQFLARPFGLAAAQLHWWIYEPVKLSFHPIDCETHGMGVRAPSGGEMITGASRGDNEWNIPYMRNSKFREGFSSERLADI
ncbi:hypothetical protein OSB04_028436 [Centaurea solstitialis]|uniref:Uncharacterized protein n=1 Tax=Centaurea solstitialis TaxID=347529 RepID=A0AA38ST69_9ASTR|nr:hypothetical protein OSB04_028436 [Centaurea solstitialis]